MASARSAWKNSLRALMIPSHSDGVVANSSPPSRAAVPKLAPRRRACSLAAGFPCAVARSQGRRGGGPQCGARHVPRPGAFLRCDPPISPKRPFGTAFGRVRVMHRPDELSSRDRDVDVPPRAEYSTRSRRCGPASWSRPLQRRGLGGFITSACSWLSKGLAPRSSGGACSVTPPQLEALAAIVKFKFGNTTPIWRLQRDAILAAVLEPASCSKRSWGVRVDDHGEGESGCSSG